MYQTLSTQDYLKTHLSHETKNAVKEVIKKVDSMRLYRGKGGEILRGGVCHLIRAMSIAGLDFQQTELMYFFEQLLENFKHPNPEIQVEATQAFESFCRAYLSSSEATIDNSIVLQIGGMLKQSQVDENVALTRGYNMAFGVMTNRLYEVLFPEVF